MRTKTGIAVSLAAAAVFVIGSIATPAAPSSTGPTAVPVATPVAPGGAAAAAEDIPAGTSLLDELAASAPAAVTHPPKRYHRDRKPAEVTVAVTGDILLHETVMAAAVTPAGGHDFTAMLAPIAPVISGADLALCHLEVPLSRDGQKLSGYPVFQAPPQTAQAIAATGYEGCSTASNHALDQRPAGVATTLDVLDAAGVGHAGTARSAAEGAAPRLYEVNGLVVGHVSATYGLNGFVMPVDQPWLVDLIDPVSGVLAEAAATRAAGADIVVVSVHWGEEYRTEPSAYQRAVAAELVASPDVDLIVGHHAHVVQPVELVGDKAVVYGLGNLISGQQGRHTAGTQDGVVVTVTMTDSPTTSPRVTDVSYVPTWVEPATYRVLPVAETLADPTLSPDRRQALEASLARTRSAIGGGASLVPSG